MVDTTKRKMLMINVKYKSKILWNSYGYDQAYYNFSVNKKYWKEPMDGGQLFMKIYLHEYWWILKQYHYHSNQTIKLNYKIFLRNEKSLGLHLSDI